MLKRIIFTSALTLMMVLSGCATDPTKEQYDAAFYGGAAPTDIQMRAEWARFIQTQLKDPQSAQIEFPEGMQMWRGTVSANELPSNLKDTLKLDGGFLFVRTSKALINAKNSFGGYTGSIRTALAFYGDRAIAYSQFTEGSWRPWKFF